MRIDIYREVKDDNCIRFEKIGDEDKKEAHAKGLLHRSVHLLLVDSTDSVCSRLRALDEFRYTGLFTTTVGTHVRKGQTYLQTLKEFVPFLDDLDWVGEFRVKDNFENEVCGLYVSKVEKLSVPEEFLVGREWHTPTQLEQQIRDQKTTPHLAEAFHTYRRNQ